MKKKTTTQKELEGTARKDRAGAIPTTSKIPQPSANLPKAAIPYYNELAEHLASNDALQAVDRLILERAAKCAMSLDKSEQDLSKFGQIAISEKGAPYVSPYFNVMASLEKRFIEYCNLLGVSPKARHLMSGTFEKKVEEKPDAIKSLLKPRTEQNTNVA